jgi:hypothetical protein
MAEGILDGIAGDEDEALQFAPNWKELIAAREALHKAGT